jgi:hypothetical protein
LPMDEIDGICGNDRVREALFTQGGTRIVSILVRFFFNEPRRAP